MNKLIIIGACIAGILGILDIINIDILKYGACALLGYTAFITLGELSPPKGQVVRQPTQSPVRERPKSIWEEFPKEEVKVDEIKKELKFKIEDTNVKEQNKIQNPAEVQKAE